METLQSNINRTYEKLVSNYTSMIAICEDKFEFTRDEFWIDMAQQLINKKSLAQQQIEENV